MTYGHCTSCLRHDIFLHLHPLNPTGNLSNPTNISPTPSTLQQPQQHIRITPLKSNAFNGDSTGGSKTVAFFTEPRGWSITSFHFTSVHTMEQRVTEVKEALCECFELPEFHWRLDSRRNQATSDSHLC